MENSRSILDEINETDQPAADQIIADQPIQSRGMDLSFLKASTGSGPIEDYLDHPLNFNKGKGMAQMIRGATGLLGSLDLAIIDIFVGLLQFTKEKKVAQGVS